MAWVTPVCNRKNPRTRTTAADFNRICGNCNIAFGTTLKTDWTINDIVDETTWNALIAAVRSQDSSITYNTDYRNLNKIEKAIMRGYIKYPMNNLYPPNELIPS